jgi:LytR cell envelope-related transcriptional attenuator
MPLVKKKPIKTVLATEPLGFTSQSLIIIIGLAVILVAAVGIAIYFYLQYQRTQDQLNKTTQSNEQAALIGEVGKLIVLPTGEQPTIATVSDINRLKGQSFFAHARNGDKVLIYTKAQEAILYDPLANKIVEVGPISLTQVTPTPNGPTPTSAPVRVAIYNGTPTAGLANKIGTEIKEKMPSATIVANSDTKNNYTSTIVVDLTGKNAASAATLAEILGAKINTLPKGEIKPRDADLLVILGK